MKNLALILTILTMYLCITASGIRSTPPAQYSDYDITGFILVSPIPDSTGHARFIVLPPGSILRLPSFPDTLAHSKQSDG